LTAKGKIRRSRHCIVLRQGKKRGGGLGIARTLKRQGETNFLIEVLPQRGGERQLPSFFGPWKRGKKGETARFKEKEKKREE